MKTANPGENQKPISTIKELYEAIGAGRDDLKFAEQVSDSVQISGISWGGASEIDYRVAGLILAIQRDVLDAYRLISGRDIRITSLPSMPMLVVHASLNLAMGIIKVSIAGETFSQVAGNRLNLARLALALSPSAGAAIASELSSVMETQAEIDAIEDAIHDKRSNTALRGNLRSGTADCESSSLGALSKQDLRQDTAPSPKDPETIPLDDRYLLLAHNYEKRIIFLGKTGFRGFWAKTELLQKEKLDVLKKLSDKAIDTGAAVEADLHISAIIRNGEIVSAYVININLPKRRGAHSLEDIQNESPQKSTLRQASLLEI